LTTTPRVRRAATLARPGAGSERSQCGSRR
jgi:hypothetical protein